MDNYFSLGFGISSMIVFLITGIVGASFQRLAMYFPVTASVLGFILSGIYVVLHIRSSIKGSSSEEVDKEEQQKPETLKSFYYMSWFVGYIVVIYLAGIYIATALFLGTFLHFEAKMRPRGILISIVLSLLMLYVVGNVMNLYWPQSLFGL